jgi:hypothetical protein
MGNEGLRRKQRRCIPTGYEIENEIIVLRTGNNLKNTVIVPTVYQYLQNRWEELIF